MHTLKLIFKNTFRHKLRTILTIISVAIAVLSFGLLRTVVSAWYAGVEASSASRLVARNAISLAFPLPLSYKEKIRQTEGVRQVSYGNWFGGIYIEEKNFFANFAMEPKTLLELYPEYIFPPEQKAAFLRDRKACAVGKKLAERFGWKIGDTIILKGTIFSGNWEFVLSGIYKGSNRNVDETQFFFHWDYLNETMKKIFPERADQIGFYMISLKDPGMAAAVSQRIDNLFQNSLAETLTETEKAFQMSFVAMTDAIIMAIQIVSFVVIIIILAVAANTMAMTARERFGEYAVFKTLGFSGWYISKLIFGESMLITLTGCVLGIILTFPAAKAFGDAMSSFFPVFNVGSKTILLDIAAVLMVGIAAALFPAYRAINIKIADGLRRIG